MTRQNDIITAARGWIGTPYRHQASVKAVGCDCLGLVRGVWRDCYGAEPEQTPAYSAQWAEAGGQELLAQAAARHLRPVPNLDFEPGDLLLFRWKPHLPAKHAGIAASNHTMIHAQENVCVCEIELSRWWRARLSHVFRFPVED
jgi:NlpC/P60 family putative phage cell wall peptidase